MRKGIKKSTLVIIFTGLLVTVPMLAFGDVRAPRGIDPPVTNMRIVEQVRHNLLTLPFPFYPVFDNLEFKVVGSHVELLGQVVNPVTKSMAGKVVKDIKGVTTVTNKIKVLPMFPSDWQIRFAEFHAVFGHSDMYRYAMGADPSIHIIVDEGRVTLVGYVSNKMDKEIAGIEANSVPGVFSVTNDLRVG